MTHSNSTPPQRKAPKSSSVSEQKEIVLSLDDTSHSTILNWRHQRLQKRMELVKRSQQNGDSSDSDEAPSGSPRMHSSRSIRSADHRSVTATAVRSKSATVARAPTPGTQYRHVALAAKPQTAEEVFATVVSSVINSSSGLLSESPWIQSLPSNLFELLDACCPVQLSTTLSSSTLLRASPFSHVWSLFNLLDSYQQPQHQHRRTQESSPQIVQLDPLLESTSCSSMTLRFTAERELERFLHLLLHFTHIFAHIPSHYKHALNQCELTVESAESPLQTVFQRFHSESSKFLDQQALIAILRPLSMLTLNTLYTAWFALYRRRFLAKFLFSLGLEPWTSKIQSNPSEPCDAFALSMPSHLVVTLLECSISHHHHAVELCCDAFSRHCHRSPLLSMNFAASPTTSHDSDSLSHHHHHHDDSLNFQVGRSLSAAHSLQVDSATHHAISAALYPLNHRQTLPIKHSFATVTAHVADRSSQSMRHTVQQYNRHRRQSQSGSGRHTRNDTAPNEDSVMIDGLEISTEFIAQLLQHRYNQRSLQSLPNPSLIHDLLSSQQHNQPTSLPAMSKSSTFFCRPAQISSISCLREHERLQRHAQRRLKKLRSECDFHQQIDAVTLQQIRQHLLSLKRSENIASDHLDRTILQFTPQQRRKLNLYIDVVDDEL